MQLLFLWQQSHDVQEPAQPGFGALPGGERSAVKAFPRGEIPLAANAEEPATSEGNGPSFTRSDLGIHNVSCAR